MEATKHLSGGWFPFAGLTWRSQRGVAYVLAAGLVMFPPPSEPATDLSRVFAKGDHAAYEVHADLHIETLRPGSEVWLPNELEFWYRFSVDVTGLSSAGIANLHYQRPYLVQVLGERFDAPQSTERIKENLDYDLQVSPANEIIEAKALNGATSKVESDDLIAHGWSRSQGPAFDDYRAEFMRLAMFVGGVDNSLDLAPRLPFAPVRLGDTWRRTVSFVPRRAAGPDEPNTKRVDFVYTYVGTRKSARGAVDRIHATLHLAEDLGGGNERMPMTLDAEADFDLDPKTRKTLYVAAKSTGEIRCFANEEDRDPIEIDRLKAETRMVEDRGKGIKEEQSKK
jgi:hypothetical protein